MPKTVLIIYWKLTNKIEVFRNLGKLYSMYNDSCLGVSRFTLNRKDLTKGYENGTIIITKVSMY
jgi:hypothetical protein